MHSEGHLSFWDHLSINQFNQWCGSSDTPTKKYFRSDICKRGYKSVLDVGAGAFSEYYGFLSDGYNIDYTATEITKKYIKNGKDSGIKVEYGSVEDLPFKDNSFDSILCTAVLNHQLSFEQSISELIRVARQRVYISFFKPFLEDLKLTSEWQNGNHLFQKEQAKFKKFHYLMKVGDETVTDTRFMANPGQLIYNPFRFVQSSEVYKIKLWDVLSQPDALPGHIVDYIVPVNLSAYSASPLFVNLPEVQLKDCLRAHGLNVPMPGFWFDKEHTPGFPKALFKHFGLKAEYWAENLSVDDIAESGWGVTQVENQVARVAMLHSYYGKDIQVSAEVVETFTPPEYVQNEEVITIPIEISNSCQVTCVHSYFSKKSIIEYLNKCQIRYWFKKSEDQTDMLILEKK